MDKQKLIALFIDWVNDPQNIGQISNTRAYQYNRDIMDCSCNDFLIRVAPIYEIAQSTPIPAIKFFKRGIKYQNIAKEILFHLTEDEYIHLQRIYWGSYGFEFDPNQLTQDSTNHLNSVTGKENQRNHKFNNYFAANKYLFIFLAGLVGCMCISANMDLFHTPNNHLSNWIISILTFISILFISLTEKK